VRAAEFIVEDSAISLRKLGKFHKDNDVLADFVPERLTHRFALHPDKWESTFFSLTNKDPRKLKYFSPEKIDIPSGTLVGDMAIANKFYRSKSPEEQEQYAQEYKQSLKPYPVDVNQYRMPELLIPKQGVTEDATNNIPTIGINVRSDGNIDYASLIVDGKKKYESRRTDSLRPYVGKTVGIVRTGNGPAVAIGQVTIGEPIEVDVEKFNKLRNQHLVPQGSTFDIEGASTKYLYPMINPVRWDNEKPIKSKGIVSRKIDEAKLSVDVPNEDWLQEKIDYAKSKGRNSYGVPYMGSTTAGVVGTPPRVRVMRLASLPGMKNEQMNVRKNDLKWLMDYMEKTGKLPPMGNSPDREYLPYIMVAYNGEAWVNEGNHRIMAAYRLNWQDMPIEIRYFDGGERIKTGPMAPEKIGL
jgi:predicted transcriptional regulator